MYMIHLPYIPSDPHITGRAVCGVCDQEQYDILQLTTVLYDAPVCTGMITGTGN